MMRKPLVALALATVLTSALAGCSSSGGGPAIDKSTPGTPSPSASMGHQAVYAVTSEGAATANNISYFSIANGQSGQEQANGAALPWSKTVDLGSGPFNFSSLSLTAQAAQGATSISCTITIDGKVKAQQTSTGPFAVVSCSASGS